MTVDLPDIAPSTEFNDLENKDNSTLKQVLDEVKQLSDWDEGSKNDNINISNFLGANFENNLKGNITAEQANIILNQLDKVMEHSVLYTPDVIQEIQALHSLLKPIANPVIGTDKMEESESDVIRSFNLSELRRDVNSINSSIEEYIGKIDGNKGYENLVVNLKEIKKVMLNPTFKNFDKLHNFLQSNNVMGDWDGDNPAPIIKGVQKFLSKVGESMNTIINEGTVINNYETIANQEKAERAEFQKSFEEFANRLKPDQMYRLSKLNDNDIDNINKFIDDKGNSDKVLSTYFTMLENQGHLKDRGDIKVFNKIKEKIETTYNQESRGERELDNMTNVDGLFNLWIQNVIADNSWNGEKIENTDSNMEKRSKGHQYSADQLKDRFDTKNEERKSKNEDLMRSFDNVVIDDLDLSNVKKIFGENGEIKLVVTKNHQDEELTVENFRSKLNITIRAPEGCRFFGNEFNQAIENAKQGRFNQISDKIPDPEPETQSETSPEEEVQIDSLELGDIQVHLFKVEEADVIGAINSAKDTISDENKDALTGKINDVINALRVPGKAVNGSGSESIQKLQKTIQETLKLNPKIDADGKLGKNTLFAIREYLGVASKGEELRYEIPRSKLSTGQQAILNDFENQEDPDLAEKMLREPRTYLNSILGDSNGEPYFPGKEAIGKVQQNGAELRLIQLQLVPYYKGLIQVDGKIGPRTLTAIEEYIKANPGKEGDNRKDINIPGNYPLMKNGDKLEGIIKNNVAYFADGFNRGNGLEYSTADDKSIVADIDGVRYAFDGNKLREFGGYDDYGNEIWNSVQDSKDISKHLKMIKNAKREGESPVETTQQNNGRVENEDTENQDNEQVEVQAEHFTIAGETYEIQTDDEGKYIQVGGVTYREYTESMTGLGYKSGINNLQNEWSYIGNFENGQMQGEGVMARSDGSKYEGNYVNGNREGEGKYTYADGDKYEGEWKNDKKDGQGTYTWSDGSKYEGEWENDKKDGQGTYTWSDGSKYEGNYVNDNMEGEGKYTWVNGNTLEGKWQNDYLPAGTLIIDGAKLNVVWDTDKNAWKVTSEGDYKDKFISGSTGEFLEE